MSQLGVIRKLLVVAPIPARAAHRCSVSRDGGTAYFAHNDFSKSHPTHSRSNAYADSSNSSCTVASNAGNASRAIVQTVPELTVA